MIKLFEVEEKAEPGKAPFRLARYEPFSLSG
jgi:hypothetical protein